MEEKVNNCESQLQLLRHIGKILPSSFLPTALCNLAMGTFTENIGGICAGTTINLCTGCGLPLAIQEISARVKMPCGHSYHLLCFAAACSLCTECRAFNCQQRMPTELCCKHIGQGPPNTPISGKIFINGIIVISKPESQEILVC